MKFFRFQVPINTLMELFGAGWDSGRLTACEDPGVCGGNTNMQLVVFDLSPWLLDCSSDSNGVNLP